MKHTMLCKLYGHECHTAQLANEQTQRSTVQGLNVVFTEKHHTDP